MDALKYPVGIYEPQPFSEALRHEWMQEIKWLPNQLESAVENLDEEILHKPYRPGGWTIHQLVHHVADSHANALIRFKMGLTETNPEIKPYNQDAWVQLADTKNLPINISLTLLHGIHLKWTALLKDMQATDWLKTMYHPEYKKEMTLWYMLGLYAWHGKYHTAHILRFREREKV